MRAVLNVAEKSAAWEREDVAVAPMEQWLSSTTPGCITTMQHVPGVKQAAPVQDWCSKKRLCMLAVGRAALGEEKKKNHKTERTGRMLPKLWAGHPGMAPSRNRRAVEISSKGSPWRTWRKGTAHQGHAQCHLQLPVPVSRSETGATTPRLGAVHGLRRWLGR